MMFISICQSINRITCSKLLRAFKPSESLSQLVGVNPLNHFIPAEHFLLLAVFFPQVSTGLPTHPSYLPVPAETRPHLAFCIHPHISLLVCLIFDQVELTGRNVKVVGWERRWQRHDLFFSTNFHLRCSSVICSTCSCIFFFFGTWFAETADSICDNQFNERASCCEGREWRGERVSWSLCFNSNIQAAVDLIEGNAVFLCWG